MIYIITGTSSGIGKALAKFYLENGDHVIGISRNNAIEHENFKHIVCDLSDKQQLHDLALLEHTEKENYPIRLINNAGIMGDIHRSHELTLTHYVDMAMVNLVAPQFLCSYVLQTFGFDNVDTIDRKSTRLNSSHVRISYAVFCLKKKKK